MYILKKANIFDPVSEHLTPDLFDSQDRLIPERRLQLLQIVQQLSNEGLYGVYILGSILGYQYSPTTDIDIWAVVDDAERVQITGSGGHLLPGTQHPVNIKYMTFSEMYPNKEHWVHSYDLFTDTWINKPSPRTPMEIGRFDINKPYLKMLTREMDRQTHQMFKAEGTPRLLKEVRDVTDLYRKLDLSRKFVYDRKIGPPKKSIRDAAYKYVERKSFLKDNTATLERYVRKVLDKNK